MYDPVRGFFTAVASDDKPPSSPSKPNHDDDYEDERSKRPSDASANPPHDDEPPRHRREREADSQSQSPERKRKRERSPDDERARARTPEIKRERYDHSRDDRFSRDDRHRPDSNQDDHESKRRRFDGEKDRIRRFQNQRREAHAGAYARRDGVTRYDNQQHNQRDRQDRQDRRGPHHGNNRRTSPQFRHNDAPPLPHLAVEARYKDPEPERRQEQPAEPQRKLKRPMARYNPAEREALRKQQQQLEADREREAANVAASRGVDDVVRSHYNAVPERGKEWRKTDSKIRGLRSFNNWVKSTLIQKFAKNEDYQPGDRSNALKVLDIGCGKGGDLLKWKSAPQPVELYVGADSADVSISQAKERFTKMKDEDRRRNRGRPSNDRFHAEFFILDAWSDTAESIPLIRDVGFDMDTNNRWGGGGFDVVSLMFCMHYAFESEDKIRGMLKNVSGSLRRGGRFIGTIPSSDKIYEGIQKNGHDFGNSLYKVSFPKIESARKLPDDGAWRPAWGWKYSFFLEESVEDVPEYVVPWEAFRALAFEYNLKLEYKRLFEDIWEDEKEDRVLGPLSERMGVKKKDGSGEILVKGEEWEACSIYMGFCFRKI
ncbi:mRNA cap guanine-N7 methyltransferase [Orbilia oligospora]|uniref:mRNA cap guanine-N(7) methyltransferase n=1 Tax=Orbilia oligospora TaxID=2813651 RepID=A0A6G1M9R3_ORBOL|nr:mRNA cap guanine-N7 methyltransferase [Orbilia oligospora]KAF3203411.1 mRNA cap guanine-N7 methyltransferase [Orbilia oligospora]KAF3214957.1 mRNA cap guanine-N7 methyltransferase [Orbilia oligospora]KAF3216452.1 mRNA cap guanine-N7 methyltransferase [Orbilia oligospora]KAF3251061.1 mRNA cap guanine-N7 methyltransferase [Orbilia oligospora]